MKFISMLRGINVSGQKKIKMNELKVLYQDLGFENVISYIQSGNVIFETTMKDLVKLQALIEKAIEEKYGFSVPVIIRTHKEMDDIINNCPFVTVGLEEEGTRVLLGFLSSIPDKDKIQALLKHVLPPESLIVDGNNIYLYCPDGYGKSKLSNNFIERKLGLNATTRNWKTVCKLHELSLS